MTNQKNNWNKFFSQSIGIKTHLNSIQFWHCTNQFAHNIRPFPHQIDVRLVVEVFFFIWFVSHFFFYLEYGSFFKHTFDTQETTIKLFFSGFAFFFSLSRYTDCGSLCSRSTIKLVFVCNWAHIKQMKRIHAQMRWCQYNTHTQTWPIASSGEEQNKGKKRSNESLSAPRNARDGNNMG